jgi:hypothetical protein
MLGNQPKKKVRRVSTNDTNKLTTDVNTEVIQF